jgi:WD40 repeat protein
MGGTSKAWYAAWAVAGGAAAFALYFFLLKPSVEPKQSALPQAISLLEKQSMSAEHQPPKVQDSLIAEIDGVTQRIQLPNGERNGVEDLASAPALQLSPEEYTGLDAGASTLNTGDLWFQQRVDNLLFGHVVTSEGRDTAPIYVCDTGQRRCEHTIYPASFGVAIIPQGAVSRTGQHLLMIAQHDTPNIETGARWDLLVYQARQLLSPMRTFDISTAIDERPAVGYDTVSSVAWSPDEKRVAIATSQKIFVVDVQSGTVTQVFEAPIPADEDADPVWNNETLIWSLSGRYIAFASYSGESGTSETTDEEASDTVTIIDLDQENAVKDLVIGEGIHLIGSE